MTKERKILFTDPGCLKGIGSARSKQLARLGLRRVYDLLFHLPRDYEDRRRITPIRKLKEGRVAVISGTVLDVEFKRGRSRQGILEVLVSDGTGALALTWFNARASWTRRFRDRSKIVACGKVQYYRGPQIVSPDYALGDNAEQSPKFGRILPLYPLTEGISQVMMRGIVRSALDMAAEKVVDIIPPALAEEKGFGDKTEALRTAHFPDSPESAAMARKRLAYEELLVFQTAFALRRSVVKNLKGCSFKTGRNVERRIRRLFPFEFTEAQNEVIEELCRDLRSERPMHRLLQGDVGCGKTVVAVYALLSVLAESSKGYQTAFMAPTEVLAEQHYLTLERLLAGTNVRILLLKGSLPPQQRCDALAAMERGEVDLVVGTHALLQEDVAFRKLALAVID